MSKGRQGRKFFTSYTGKPVGGDWKCSAGHNQPTTPQYRSSFQWERHWRLRRCAALRTAKKSGQPRPRRRRASRLRRLSNTRPSFEGLSPATTLHPRCSPRHRIRCFITTSSVSSPRRFLCRRFLATPRHLDGGSWRRRHLLRPSIAVCEGIAHPPQLCVLHQLWRVTLRQWGHGAPR